jgi:hypothetical protein
MGFSMKVRTETDADICRRKGWVVGNYLVGTESSPSGVHTDTIEITAIGIECILARTVLPDGKFGHEQGWSLQWRDWKEVPR